MSDRKLAIEVAEVFEPLLAPSRYKAAHGGRGSGKSHFFADLMVRESLYHKGLRSICIREVQKDLKDSAYLIIKDKLAHHGLGEADGFKVYEEMISTPGDGMIIFKGMKDYTADSIKSLEGFGRAWVEEAQTLSNTSLTMLEPTIRSPGSELWFSWNPRLEGDAVDVMFRGPEKPTGAVIVRANWSDNPWFPEELETLRLDHLRRIPDQYDHIWEGGYVTAIEGAYYAKHLAEARLAGRIGEVGRDPVLSLRAFWDIGGAGKTSDATSIWIAQFSGVRVRVLDYYEAVGQPLEAHLNWLRGQGYDRIECNLPHDANEASNITGITYETHIKAAGFPVKTIPNQGKGAALKRVEVGRRTFPAIWFNEATCKAGLSALGWYHEKIDEKRNVGLGPEHDWSSHAADAFGLMCTVYGTQPQTMDRRFLPDPATGRMPRIQYPKKGGVL